MPDQQPHTPSRIGLIAAWRKYNGLTLTRARDEVDRVIAAAEQRGAVKALRDAATAIEKNNIVFDGDHYQPCNSCMSIHMNWLDYRADRIADKEVDE